MKIIRLVKITSLTVLVGMTLIGCEDEVSFKGHDYKVITSPITGKKWLDRNLGAKQACTSSTDKACYGDYYQWGRLADSHEKEVSFMTTILALDIFDIGNKFVVGYVDWTSSDDNGNVRKVQWAKIDGTGICPVGFRVPTQTELANETTGYERTNNTNIGAVKVTNSTTAFQNFLKFPVAGNRNLFDGSLVNQDLRGSVWSSSVDWHGSQGVYFDSENADWSGFYRAFGFSIRCVEN